MSVSINLEARDIASAIHYDARFVAELLNELCWCFDADPPSEGWLAEFAGELDDKGRMLLAALAKAGANSDAK